jgi:hypothetical protein
MFMGWGALLLILAGVLVLAAGSWAVFRRYLSRDARYRRRLRRRHELQRASDRARQRRMLEAQMREVHEQGLRWKEAPAPDEALDRSWGRRREESLTSRDEA